MTDFFNLRAPIRTVFYLSTSLANISIVFGVLLFVFVVLFNIASQPMWFMLPIASFMFGFFVSSFFGLLFIFSRWLQDNPFSNQENLMIALAFIMHIVATFSLFFYQANIPGSHNQDSVSFMDAAFFLIDQMSKGALNDVFEVFELKLSDVEIQEWQPQSKLAVLCLRIYSGLFFVFVFLSLKNYIRAKRRMNVQA